MERAAAVGGPVQAVPPGWVLVLQVRTPPSEDPMLEAEWVLERTSRVIPAVGTAERQVMKHQWDGTAQSERRDLNLLDSNLMVLLTRSD